MDSPGPPLLPIDAATMAAVLLANRGRWGWDERYTAQIVGKLMRGTQAIPPPEPDAIETIISLCGEGWGLWHALKQAKVTQRQYFAWIARSHSTDPDAAPYREFRDRLLGAFTQKLARDGIGDPDGLRLLGLT